MENNNNKLEIFQRLTAVEVKVKELCGDIKNLKDNDLAHIHSKITDIYSKLDSNKNWLIGVLVTVIFTLIGVVIMIFK